MLLAVAMATADALLDALGIPGKVVVHDQRAELEIDAFRCGLSSDHNARPVPGNNRQEQTAYRLSATR